MPRIIRPQVGFSTTLTRSLTQGGAETEVYISTLPVETSGVIEVNPTSSGRREFIYYTGTSSSGGNHLTGTIRGVSFSNVTGTAITLTGSTSLAYPHSASEQVIISNGFYEQIMADLFNGDAAIQGRPYLSADTDGTDVTQLATHGEVLRAAMGSITIPKVTITGTAGETLTAGQIVYLKSADGRWYKSAATDTTTINDVIMGFAQGAGTAGVAITGGVLISGVDSNQSSLVAGTSYYVSNTGGTIQTSAGTNSKVIGIATSATQIILNYEFQYQITDKQQAALAGTSGTPAATNLYVTNSDASSGFDQTQTTENTTITIGEADATGKHIRLAQSFIPTNPSIRGVQLHKIADTGSFSGTVTVTLEADSGGNPSGSALATATINNAAWLLLGTGLFGALFASEYTTLTLGSTYWIKIVTSTADNSNHPNIGSANTNLYANGLFKTFNTTDGWVTGTGDLTFKTITTTASKVGRAGTNGLVAGSIPYGVDSGSTDAYVVTFPAYSGAALADGEMFSFKPNTVNTGACTLNPNGIGATAIVLRGNITPANGDIPTSLITVQYSSTNSNFILITGGAIEEIHGTIADNINYTSSGGAGTNYDTTVTHGLGRMPRLIEVSFQNLWSTTTPTSGNRYWFQIQWDNALAVTKKFVLQTTNSTTLVGADTDVLATLTMVGTSTNAGTVTFSLVSVSATTFVFRINAANTAGSPSGQFTQANWSVKA